MWFHSPPTVRVGPVPQRVCKAYRHTGTPPSVSIGTNGTRHACTARLERLESMSQLSVTQR